MPHQKQAQKAKTPFKKPTIADLPAITNLGLWAEAEGKVRERALAQGMSAEEIESLLDEIREARKTNLKSNDDE